MHDLQDFEMQICEHFLCVSFLSGELVERLPGDLQRLALEDGARERHGQRQVRNQPQLEPLQPGPDVDVSGKQYSPSGPAPHDFRRSGHESGAQRTGDDAPDTAGGRGRQSPGNKIYKKSTTTLMK